MGVIGIWGGAASVLGLAILSQFFGISTALSVCIVYANLSLGDLLWVGGRLCCWALYHCREGHGTSHSLPIEFLRDMSRRGVGLEELPFRMAVRCCLLGRDLTLAEECGLDLIIITWLCGPFFIGMSMDSGRLFRLTERLQRLRPSLRNLIYYFTDIRLILFRSWTANQFTLPPTHVGILTRICACYPEHYVSKTFLPPLPNLESSRPLNPAPFLYIFFSMRLIISANRSDHLVSYHIHTNNVQKGSALLRRFLFKTNAARLMYTSFRVALPWVVYVPFFSKFCENILTGLRDLVRGGVNWSQEGEMMGEGGEGGVTGVWNQWAAAAALRDALPPDFATTLRCVSLSPACRPDIQTEAGNLLDYLRTLAIFPTPYGDDN